MEGFNNINPQIDKIDFRIKGAIRLFFIDGRKVEVPLKYFPSIKHLNSRERNRYHIADGQILLFDNCNEVFHIEQFLGKEQQYSYNFKNTLAAETKMGYGKRS